MEGSNFCFAEDYHTKFDPQIYLSKFYSSAFHTKDHTCQDGLCIAFVMESVHKLLMQIPETRIENVLEFGCGPCIHLAAILSQKADNLYLAEYAEPNLKVLRNWKNGGAGHNWTKIMEFIAKLQSRNSVGLEEKARKCIRGIFKCDIQQSKIVPDLPISQVDLLLSSLCIETAVSTLAEYELGIVRFWNLILPGGYLILVGDLSNPFFHRGDDDSNNYYSCGNEKFVCFPVGTINVRRAVEKAGFLIEEFHVHDRAEYEEEAEGLFVLLAKKQNELSACNQ